MQTPKPKHMFRLDFNLSVFVLDFHFHSQTCEDYVPNPTQKSHPTSAHLTYFHLFFVFGQANFIFGQPIRMKQLLLINKWIDEYFIF